MPFQVRVGLENFFGIDGVRGAAVTRTMTMKQTITEKLQAAFAPSHLDVVDESHLHEGHSGHRDGGETHFRVQIVADAFAGKSRLDRHRLVNTALATELASSVHALAIRAQATGE